MSPNFPLSLAALLLFFATSCQPLTRELTSLVETAQSPTAVADLLPNQQSTLPPDGPNDEPAQEQTAVSRPGYSRALPLPPDQPILLPNWQVDILSHQRGTDAWDTLQEYAYNSPPAANEEYLLVEYSISRTDTAAEVQTINLGVTGSAAVLYYGFKSGLIPPTPLLQTTLAGGESATGWAAYRIRANETNLMVVVDAYNTPASPDAFVALSPGASVQTAVNALDSIQATDLGQTIDTAVPWGQIATMRDWQMNLSQLIRGPEAWDLLLATNQFNDPPPSGMEYLLVYAQATYIGTDDTGQRLDYGDFALLQADGTPYERPYQVIPKPELSYVLYPGGSAEGWILLQTAVDHADPLLQFNADYGEATRNRRYFSLTVHGR